MEANPPLRRDRDAGGGLLPPESRPRPTAPLPTPSPFLMAAGVPRAEKLGQEMAEQLKRMPAPREKAISASRDSI